MTSNPESDSAPRHGSRILHELVVFKNGLSMTGGDVGSTSQLFFDNLSTLLGALLAIQAMSNFGVPQDVLDNTLFGRVVPGVGITLFAGNIYYSWQAIRMTNRWGRQYTAQPYGLNTPAAFSFVYNIIYTVYFSNVDSLGPEQAFLLGYKVALAANFLTGVVTVVFGCFGPIILRAIPPAALLVPIAGLAIAFLGLEQLSNSIAAPLVGYMTIMFVYLGWYAGVKIGFGQYRIPEACAVILVGVILGWATGLNDKEDVKDAAKLFKWWGPDWTAKELFEDFDLIKDYLGIVIPIGISAASSSLMCLVSAKEAGDPFPVRESMIADGIGTMIASFFGSPFGTVIYIGHPVYKRNGAKVGYSLANGTIYLIFSWIGILALMESIVNRATIGPIVFVVCLMINEETLNFMPSRHYPAYIIGLFPSIYDWTVNVSGRSPLSDPTGTYNTAYPTGSAGWIGVLGWKRGSLLVSMIWVAMIVMVLDRKWIMATAWAFVGALFALFGIIHVPVAGFKTFTEPTWDQCENPNGDAVPTCWDHAEQWQYFVAYIMLMGVFVIIHFARKFDSSIKDIVDDPTAHAFDDWFKDAGGKMASTSEDEVVVGGAEMAVKEVSSSERDEEEVLEA